MNPNVNGILEQFQLEIELNTVMWTDLQLLLFILLQCEGPWQTLLHSVSVAELGQEMSMTQ